MAKDMTQKEFVTAYGKRWERLSADEFVHSDYSAQCLADLHSVIRGETSELLKQRDELQERLNEAIATLKAIQVVNNAAKTEER